MKNECSCDGGCDSCDECGKPYCECSCGAGDYSDDDMEMNF